MGLVPRGAAIDGDVDFDGRDLLALTKKERETIRGAGMALIFQEPMTRLDPLMKVSEHFTEVLHVHEPKLSKAEMRTARWTRCARWASRRRGYDNYPHEFSGGMRQRIMIALALALRPKFIVADEPTTALDVLVEAQILGILADIRKTYAPAILLITHNLGIVAEACDRVAVMYAGRIVEQGPVRDVFAPPQHPVHPGAAALDDLADDAGAALDPGCPAGSGAPAGWLPVPPALRARDAGLRGQVAALDRRGSAASRVLAARIRPDRGRASSAAT